MISKVHSSFFAASVDVTTQLPQISDAAKNPWHAPEKFNNCDTVPLRLKRDLISEALKKHSEQLHASQSAMNISLSALN